MSAQQPAIPVHLWAAYGSADEPPDRLRVETCADCAALVPVDRFDVHGLWHRRLHRVAGGDDRVD